MRYSRHFAYFADVNFDEVSAAGETLSSLLPPREFFRFLCYISVKLITGLSYFFLLSVVSVIRMRIAFLGTRRDRRNFANSNKTAAAVSATRVRGSPRNAKNVSADPPCQICPSDLVRVAHSQPGSPGPIVDSDSQSRITKISG